MRIAQWHHVINVESAWISDDGAAVRGQPFAGCHPTLPVGSIGNRGLAFGNQHLVAGILAIPIGVGPVFPIMAVVVRQRGWDC